MGITNVVAIIVCAFLQTGEYGMSDIMVTDNGDGADIVLRDPMVEGEILAKTTSTDATPTALQGDVEWIPEGSTINGSSVLKNEEGDYVKWVSLILGSIITTSQDKGNEGVTNYFKLQDYPDTIIASGSGTPSANSEYNYHLVLASGSVLWANVPIDLGDLENGMYIIGQTEVSTGLESWAIEEFTGATFVTKYYTGMYTTRPTTPPKSPAAWLTTLGTSRPPPSLRYEIPVNHYVGRGDWEGILVFSEHTPFFTTDNADFYEDNGIGTSVYISLFDQPGWMESLKRTKERIPSAGQLNRLLDRPITGGTVAKIQRVAASQLSWLKAEGVCSEIRIEVRNPSVGLIEIDITATEPNDTVNRYKAMWNQQEQKLVSFVRNSDRNSAILR